MKTSLFAIALLCAPIAAAQIATAQIDVAPLSDARDFSAGLLDAGTGGLDRNAWQGTSAELAAHLIDALPDDVDHPVAEALIDAALLSGGVPPEGDTVSRDAYTEARNTYLLATGRGERLAALAQRDRDLGQTPRLRTDLALARGDTDSACADSDGQIDGRSQPYWAKLRAFCHILRNEAPAAELTADLIRQSGHEDAVFFDLLAALSLGRVADGVVAETPLHEAMAHEVTARAGSGAPKGRAGRLDALLDRMAGETPEALLPDMAQLTAGEIGPDGTAPSFGVEDAVENRSAQGTAQLYVLAVRNRSGAAATAFLARMEDRGRLGMAARHLAPVLQRLPAPALVSGDLSTLAKAAVITNDLGLLMGLFQALPADGEDAQRLALVSDALGGGFRLTPVGDDIEGPLLAGETGAAHDLVLALGLGARMSDAAARALESADLAVADADLPHLLALASAASEQSRAEVALRAARLLAGDPEAYALGQTVAALQTSGLDRFARQVAAYHYADRL